MSFLFRKNGSGSRRRIKEKLRGRNSDRGKREEEERVGYDNSLPPPPSPWGFLFAEDFVRVDGNLKAVIVDEEGLDVIYWRKLLELDNSRKIRKNPRRSDGDESGTNHKGGESTEDAFSFDVKKSQFPLSSGGQVQDSNDQGARYYTSSSASPSRETVNDYGAVGNQSQSKFQSPGGSFLPIQNSDGRYPSRPSSSSSSPSGVHDYSAVGINSQSKFQAPGGSFPPIQIGDGRSPPLPLPPGQYSAAIASSSSASLPPAPPNQTSEPALPSNGAPPPPHPSAGAPPPPHPSAGAPPPPYPSAGAPPPPYPSAGAPPPPHPSAGPPPSPPPPCPPVGAPPPPPPPIPAKAPPPPPPPPGKKTTGPPPPPPGKTGPPKPPGNPKEPTSSSALGKIEDPAQPKLKPLHWDKVNPDKSHSMVWHRIDNGSFNFDGDLMEALFGYVGARKPSEATSVPQNPTVSTTQTYILDPRKSQNKAIVLKSLGMTKEEIIDLVTEGHDADPDTLEKLSGIAPTQEEQTEIIEFSGDPTKLADAESLLFHILRAVPSAFDRFNVMLFKINYGSEVAQQKASLQTLESACNELRARGLFMKLLEAILKAGNRMNAGTARGNAQAFNLTALRKLSDVKSVDGKTTLLHFVVEEVVRSEGKRAAMNKISNDNAGGGSIADASREEQETEFVKLGLPIIGGLSSEFTNVKKAAGIDYDSFVATTVALGNRVKETRRLLDRNKGKEDGCLTKLRSFFESAEEELKAITDDQGRIIELVKRTTNYYQAGALKERNLFQLFVIIRDFLGMVDNACSEIARNQRRQKPATTRAGASSSAAATTTSAAAPQRNAVRFPILPPNFMSEHSRYSSSDSDSDS